MKRYTPQDMLLHRHLENLRSVVRDLTAIRGLIPAETSRYGCLFDSNTQGEEMAIVEARKSALLSYIQVVCEDNIKWSQKLLDEGYGKPKRKGAKRG